MLTAARAALAPRIVVEPPDGGLIGAGVVLGGFLVYVTAVGFQYVSGLFYLAWLADPSFGGLTDARSDLQWPIGIETGSFLGATLAGGWLVTRIGERATLVCAGLLMLTGAVGAALAPSLGALVLFFGGVLGSGCSFASVACIVGVQKYFSTRRGRATGLVVAGSGVGGMVLGPALQSAIDALGWRGALVAFGIASAAALFLSALAFVPLVIVPTEQLAVAEGELCGLAANDALKPGAQAAEEAEAPAAAADEVMWCEPAVMEAPALSVPAVPAAPESTASAPAAPIPTASAPATPTPAALTTPAPLTLLELLTVSPCFTAYLLFVPCAAFNWFTTPSHLPRFAVEAAGATPDEAALLVMTQGFANMLGRLVLGVLADAFPQHKARMLSICIGSLALATILLVLLSDKLPFFFIFMLINGTMGGSIVSLQPALLIDMVGMENLALAQGLFNSVQAPAALAAGPTMGAVRGASGSYTVVWAICSVVISCAFCFTLTIASGRGVSCGSVVKGKRAVGRMI